MGGSCCLIKQSRLLSSSLTHFFPQCHVVLLISPSNLSSLGYLIVVLPLNSLTVGWQWPSNIFGPGIIPYRSLYPALSGRVFVNIAATCRYRYIEFFPILLWICLNCSNMFFIVTFHSCILFLMVAHCCLLSPVLSTVVGDCWSFLLVATGCCFVLAVVTCCQLYFWFWP